MLRGQAAEERAARYLKAQGLALLARNWRCQFGEIDLILRDGATVVFVEVRSRHRSAYGGAAESITAQKRARLQRAAAAYLAQSGHRGACRFDAVLIDGERLTWLRGAFDAKG